AGADGEGGDVRFVGLGAGRGGLGHRPGSPGGQQTDEGLADVHSSPAFHFAFLMSIFRPTHCSTRVSTSGEIVSSTWSYSSSKPVLLGCIQWFTPSWIMTPDSPTP